MPSVQDGTARADVRFLRTAQNEIAAGTMGIGGGGADNGRRVVGTRWCLTLPLYMGINVPTTYVVTSERSTQYKQDAMSTQ